MDGQIPKTVRILGCDWTVETPDTAELTERVRYGETIQGTCTIRVDPKHHPSKVKETLKAWSDGHDYSELWGSPLEVDGAPIKQNYRFTYFDPPLPKDSYDDDWPPLTYESVERGGEQMGIIKGSTCPKCRGTLRKEYGATMEGSWTYINCMSCGWEKY